MGIKIDFAEVSLIIAWSCAVGSFVASAFQVSFLRPFKSLGAAGKFDYRFFKGDELLQTIISAFTI